MVAEAAAEDKSNLFKKTIMDKIVKKICALLFTAGFIGNISAQSAVEALMLTDNDLIGTARFVGMGGAFTSLGGDISSLSQNPAGIGIYRTNEVATTLTISPPIYPSK